MMNPRFTHVVLLCRALESVCRIFIRIKSYPREKDINEGQESGGEVPRTIFYTALWTVE